MLTGKKLKKIHSETLSYWKKEVRKSEFKELLSGKETGHKLANTVDEKTCALLTLNHIITYQKNKKGEKRSRSMGDLWLKENGIYHPINVKTGVMGSEGQPNLVSLKKVISAIMNRHIDSYYLLMVKLAPNDRPATPSVHIVDMLEWLDYVTFDSGPGQLMLRARKFYENVDSVPPSGADIREKLKLLMKIYEDGEKRLQKKSRTAV